MAKYTGYINVGHSTYDEWQNNTNGNGYNVDLQNGCQCWDLISLFYYNIGFPAGYPILTNSAMYTMWNNRSQNVGYGGVTYFDLITNVNDIKKGDIIVFNYTASNPYGHAGFATVNYNDWTPDPNEPYEFPILSQNNGGTPDPDGGSYTNIHGYDIRLFLGAFRFKAWQPTPTPNLRKVSKTKFPFFITANKRRGSW